MAEERFDFGTPVVAWRSDGTGVHQEDLSCADIEWTPLAPDHAYVPWMAPRNQQACKFCGQPRPEEP